MKLNRMMGDSGLAVAREGEGAGLKHPVQVRLSSPPAFCKERWNVDIAKLSQTMLTEEGVAAVERLFAPEALGDADEEVMTLIAEHEIAHAVMRRICGLRATTVLASPLGGLCEGTGEHVGPDQSLLVTLGGVAWEARDQGVVAKAIDFYRAATPSWT